MPFFTTFQSSFYALIFCLVLFFSINPITTNAQQTAFPEAKGFGKYTVGGRGGEVLFVTNLNDSGPGSFREACRATGPRIVVFNTGGEIQLESNIKLRNPYITIAGQTAPGDGITIRKYGIIINTSQVIMRGIKVRIGDDSGKPLDGISIISELGPINNVILDHNTVSWGIDENFAVNGKEDPITNVTISNNISSECLNDPALHGGETHAMGMLISKNATNFSIVGNLFAHNLDRQPKFAVFCQGEIVNNVVYDWGYRATYFDDGTKADVLGNYYKVGPDWQGRNELQVRMKSDFLVPGRLYMEGNIGPYRTSDDMDEWAGVSGTYGGGYDQSDWRSSQSVITSGITASSAFEAYDNVLASVGAFHRDAHDLRILNDVVNETGGIILRQSNVGGYLNLDPGTPLPDEDNDGMPDEWEIAEGLNPHNAADVNEDQNNNGYTNIEDYINHFFFTTNQPTNSPPTIGLIDNQTIEQGQVLGPINFAISDLETVSDSLTISASVVDTVLIQASSLMVLGSGGERTLTLLAGTDTTGTTEVRLEISDGDLTTLASFEVTVVSQGNNNTAPTIGSIQNQNLQQDETLGPLYFTINDIETSPDSLEVSVISSDSLIVPFEGLILGGSGAARSITITPSPGATGNTSITIKVSDGEMSTTMVFELTVESPENNAPTITAISDQIIDQDQSLGPLDFTVGDLETEIDSLQVFVQSSDSLLIQNLHLMLSGGGSNRNLTVIPPSGYNGTSTISLSVWDGALISSTEFALTVLPSTPSNLPPTIDSIASQVTDQDLVLGPIAFMIGDPDTPFDSLQLVATSSDTLLVPSSGLALGGSGSNRTLTIFPSDGSSGLTSITVTVTDGEFIASSTFDLTVQSTEIVNTTPDISSIPDQTMNQEEVLDPIAFSVGDNETPSEFLTVTASSSNNSLISLSGITIDGIGADRTLTITPKAGKSGNSEITITVSDGELTTSTMFNLEVVSIDIPNTPPTISNLEDQIIDQGEVLGPLDFTIGDNETASDDLVLFATSNNSNLVSINGMDFGGSGSNRTLTITPNPEMFGIALISIRVSDGIADTTATFELVVQERQAQSDSLSISLSIQDLSCFNSSDGSASVSVSGGVAPYSYSWSNGATGSTINDLEAGSYTILVQDAADSLISRTVVVEAPNQIIISGIVVDETCEGNNGSISLSVTGANNPTINWSNGSNQSELSDIVAGNYTVQVTDNNGCSSQATFIVADNKSSLSITEEIKHSFCSNDNGSIQIAISNGSGSYEYYWSIGANSRKVSNLAAGTYSLEVVDVETGCSTFKSFLVEDRQSEITLEADITNATCQTLGAISLAATGAGPFEFYWSTGATTSYIENLEAGAYTVNVVDSKGCNKQQSFRVEVIPGEAAFVLTSEIQPASCKGNDGSINVTVSGGEAPYTFEWHHSVANNRTLNGLAAGTYKLTIKDKFGCFMETSYTVTSDPGPAKPTITQPGDSLLSSEATYYQWFLNGVEIAGATSRSIAIDQTGEYSVKVFDQNECFAHSDILYAEEVENPTTQTEGIKQLDLYPVPVKSKLHIKLVSVPVNASFQIEIFELNGLPVLQEEAIKDRRQFNYTVDLSRLKTGVYILKLKLNNELVIRRFIKS